MSSPSYTVGTCNHPDYVCVVTMVRMSAPYGLIHQRYGTGEQSGYGGNRRLKLNDYSHNVCGTPRMYRNFLSPPCSYYRHEACLSFTGGGGDGKPLTLPEYVDTLAEEEPPYTSKPYYASALRCAEENKMSNFDTIRGTPRGT